MPKPRKAKTTVVVNGGDLLLPRLSKRARHLFTRYGITSEQYDALLQEQGQSCAVCGRHQSEFKSRLAVDHDHHSGHVRGLLCINCNRRIVGRHRKEKGADLLLAAYTYLTKDVKGWIVPQRKKRKKRKKRK